MSIFDYIRGKKNQNYKDEANLMSHTLNETDTDNGNQEKYNLINRFIRIKDVSRVYTKGEYSVGSDIPVGEYYMWGDDIWYSYKRKREKESVVFEKEAYDLFQLGDYLVIERGTMTPIDNVIYCKDKTNIIYPEHIYRVGKEIPNGYYIFRYDKSLLRKGDLDEDGNCRIFMYNNYASSCYKSTVKKSGCELWDGDIKHVKIINGIAEYYGEYKFDEKEVVRKYGEDVSSPVLHGLTIYSSEIMDIKLYEKNDCHICFLGKVVVDVLYYAIYSVGDELKWYAEVSPRSFQSPYKLTLCFKVKEEGIKEYIVEVEKLLYHYDRKRDLKWYSIEVGLPEAFCGKQIEIELLGYNQQETKSKFVGNISSNEDMSELYISKKYAEDLANVRRLLNGYKDIDIDYEIQYLKKAPDLLPIIIECLEEIENKKEAFAKKKIEDNEVVFYVPATYNKKFYCAAKLADCALEVKIDEDKSVYQVRFKSNQISEIEIMSYLFYDSENQQERINRSFLIENSYFYYALEKLQTKINELLKLRTLKCAYAP